MIRPSRPLALLLLAGAFAIPAPALAQSDTPAPRLITITGTGDVRAAPDQAQLSAGVVSEAKTAAAALTDNNNKMAAVFAALRKLGVPGKDIQTSGFSVAPQYPPYNSKEERHITGYQISNTVTVKLSEMKKLGQALDALVAAGANQVNSVSFSIADPAAALARARAEAVKDARTEAETYARAADVSLGPIQSISEPSGEGPRPMFAVTAMRAAPEGVPVAAGEQTVSASVTISWQIR